MITEPADINNIYGEALDNIRNKKPLDGPKTSVSTAEQEQAAKEYYANIRTNVGTLVLLSLYSSNFHASFRCF